MAKRYRSGFHLDPKVDETILRWVSLEPAEGTMIVRYREVFDAPEAGTFDIGEFQAVNPDEPEGVAEERPTLEEALKAASVGWGAHIDHYINESMLDSEYESYRRK